VTKLDDGRGPVQIGNQKEVRVVSEFGDDRRRGIDSQILRVMIEDEGKTQISDTTIDEQPCLGDRSRQRHESTV
jgi:hypothetical protein